MPRPSRRAIAICLIVALAAVLAACGGGDSGEDLSAGLTPAELLARSAEEAAAVESFRIAIEAQGAVELDDPSSVPGGPLLSGRIDVSGEGPVQLPDRASIDARIGLSGPSLQGNVTRVGDDVFVGVLGQDFQVRLPPEQVALLDLGALYPTLVGWATDPTEAGREDIDGTATVHVRAGLDPARALADLGPLLGADAITPAQARAALATGSLDAWIGTEDLLPRRVRLVVAADASDLDAGVGAVEIDLTADLSAYDEPVDIQPPRDPRPLDLDQLGGLTGG